MPQRLSGLWSKIAHTLPYRAPLGAAYIRVLLVLRRVTAPGALLSGHALRVGAYKPRHRNNTFPLLRMPSHR